MSHHWFKDKSVLVTGAAGTVGSGLLRALLRSAPRRVCAFDNHEHGLFHLQQELPGAANVCWLMGDVRDLDRLRHVMKGVDVVFHCAAFKHVCLGEDNSFELVQTNLVGLQNVIQAAAENHVGQAVFTSSDKAVNPTTAMGASKLLGEKLVATANRGKALSPTRFASVRFGNILGSSGSVVEIFRAQIANGGPVTLTDRRMTRYVMDVERGVSLVLRAAELTAGGEVFVLKMPALRIQDLARVMIQELAPSWDHRPEALDVVEVGARPGEKLHEELLSEAEVPHAVEDAELIVYLGECPQQFDHSNRPYLRNMKPVTRCYHSGKLPPMTEAEVQSFLVHSRILAPAPRLRMAR